MNKKILNLEIDLGNYNIKTNTGVIFKSTFTEGNNINPLGESVITYDGKSYIMEKGKFENKFNKAKKCYLPNLLYAIIKSSPKDYEDFDLVLNYPLDNDSVAEEFKANLTNKEFNVIYQRGQSKTERTIRIHKVTCIAESLASYYTLDKTTRGLDLIITDIGSRTTNVSVWQNRKMFDKFTIPHGTIDLFDAIIKRFNNDNGDNKTTEECERLINIGYINGVENEYKRFLDELMNQIDKRLDRKTYENYYCGGGSILLQEYIEDYLQPNGKVMPNALFSNVNGSHEIIGAIKSNGRSK